MLQLPSNLYMTAPAMSTPSTIPNEDNVRASVTHLLSRACTLPCTAASQAFSQLVQPTERFQLALDALLPILTGGTELPQRILVCYIIYSMYASHPINMNPFKTAFVDVFTNERDRARECADRGSASDVEQLVWAVWKVLKGEGTDLGPYTPVALAQTALSPQFRASELAIFYDLEGMNNSEMHSKNSSSESSQASSDIWKDASDGLSGPSNYSSRRSSARNSPIADEDAMIESLAQGMRLLLEARSRVLSLAEQRVVTTLLHHTPTTPMVSTDDLPALIAHNPPLGYPLLVSLLRLPRNSQANITIVRGSLDVLRHLPPLLPSFDILGRLLQDPVTIPDMMTNGTTTIADLVRTDVLGSFTTNVIRWIERAEADEQEGLINDDRVPKAVQALCRFYNSLIKLNIIDPAFDADTAEMAHFALSHSRYEEANNLYRVLVSSRF